MTWLNLAVLLLLAGKKKGFAATGPLYWGGEFDRKVDQKSTQNLRKKLGLTR